MRLDVLMWVAVTTLMSGLASGGMSRSPSATVAMYEKEGS
jgi:hypothetical protein